MKLIKTEDAVGHVLCHDLTQIIKDQYKDARFRKGHVVTQEDIPVLLSMGKEHLYVWEMTPGMLHENDAAERLLALCGSEHMTRTAVKEGKIELRAACDGLFLVRCRAPARRQLAGRGHDRHAQGRHRRPQGRQARGHARDPARHRGREAAAAPKQAAGSEPLLSGATALRP